jgi:hypothetical protein
METSHERPTFVFALFRLNLIRDSSVGIATRYGLDGPVIEARWGARFFAPVQTEPKAHTASYTVGPGLSRG